MESGGRKLLPRVLPAEHHTVAGPVEPIRNANHHPLHAKPAAQWHPVPGEEQTGRKRKRNDSDDHQLQRRPTAPSLPSLQHLLTAQPRQQSRPSPAQHAAHPRLIRTSDDGYVHDGVFRFRSPPTLRDFPVSILEDPRPLSFALVEPDLMDILRRAWYLRQYIRLKSSRGETWLDHVFFNDSFGVENALYTWTSRYEPGTAQYPASKLYANCLWLFFHRSVQASQPSPAYSQVVEEGIHYVYMIEKALVSSVDRSILLLPLFLLGVSAFHTDQRRAIWDSLDRLDPSLADESVNHAAKSLERIWGMMDDGRAAATWEWERWHAHEWSDAVKDRVLVDFLKDPLAQPSPLRSPDEQDFDSGKFKSGLAQQRPERQSSSASVFTERPPTQRDMDVNTPPSRIHTPPRNPSIMSIDASDAIRPNGTINNHSHRLVEIAPSPKPTAAPQNEVKPTPSPNSQHQHQQNQNAQPPSRPHLHQSPSSNESIPLLHRKTPKSRSNIPPCPVCGKELKNPSDAQKHQLQHLKPFRCHEANCTRAQGFATENDLQRHRKSVHGAAPRIGNKIGYVCAACPEPGDGLTTAAPTTGRKWWPRLDNFKAHVRRKHQERDEEGLIALSATATRPTEPTTNHADPSLSAYYYSSSTSAATTIRWSEDPNSAGNSRKPSAHEYPSQHTRGEDVEGGYPVNFRESPEGSEDRDGEEQRQQQRRDEYRRLDDDERNGMCSDDYREGEALRPRHGILEGGRVGQDEVVDSRAATMKEEEREEKTPMKKSSYANPIMDVEMANGCVHPAKEERSEVKSDMTSSCL